MTLQLVDNLWKLKVDTTLDATISQHLLGTFDNLFVVVNVTSDSALPIWKQAGSIGQAINFGRTLAYGEVKQIYLNTYLLLQFPLLSGEIYDLYYFPLTRLVESQIKIWEYIGDTIDTSINQLIATLQTAGLTNWVPQLQEEPNSNVLLTRIIQHNELSQLETIEDFDNYLPGYF